MADNQTTICDPEEMDRDGWHWLETIDGKCAGSYFWIASVGKWEVSPSNVFTPAQMVGMGWRYDRPYVED